MRRVLVTGANKGIGRAIATAILSEADDTFVYLGSRDVGRGEGALRALVASHPEWEKRLEVLPLDVSSDLSVSEAAAQLRYRHTDELSPLYGIVNNAGIGGNDVTLAEVLEVNTVGVWRVCEALLPLLAPNIGRVVNITSAAGPNFVSTCSLQRQKFFLDPNIEWSDLRALLDECLAIEGDREAFAARGLGDGNPYGLSKACTNSYTLLLARKHPSLLINACTPGFIETDMTRKHLDTKGKTAAELGMQPPAAGARAPIFLLFGKPEGSGHYYGSDAQRSPLHRYRAPGTEPYRGSD